MAIKEELFYHNKTMRRVLVAFQLAMAVGVLVNSAFFSILLQIVSPLQRIDRADPNFDIVSAEVAGGIAGIDAFRTTVANVLGPVSLIAGILLLIWFYRAYKNIWQFRVMSYKSWWGVLGWLIPVANFVYPYQMMREMYLRTGDVLKGRGVQVGREPSAQTKLVLAWWIVQLVSIGMSFVTVVVSWNAYTLERLLPMAVCSFASNILSAGAIIMTVLVIRRYGKSEDAMYELVASGKLRLGKGVAVKA